MIHVGDQTVDVGHEVWAYSRTTRGYVVADRDGTVWSVTDSGVRSVGTVSAKHPRIVADTDGTLAGWVDPSGESPAFVVLDQATGDVVREDGETAPGMGELADEENPAYIYAIDGRTAYWRDARGAVAVDVDSGEVRVVDARARNGFDIVAAEDDAASPSSRQRGTADRPGPRRRRRDAAGRCTAAWARFSPNARLLHRRRRRAAGVRRLRPGTAGRARTSTAASPPATSGSDSETARGPRGGRGGEQLRVQSSSTCIRHVG